MFKTFGGYALNQLHKMTTCCTQQAFQGSKRRERFEKFGYDCKNASHLIRLLRMGTEVLLTGEIHIVRDDAQELLDIKRGKWSLHDVRKEAAFWDMHLKMAMEVSTLPDETDFKAAESLLISILSEHFA
jgi:hypothetical protein